MRKTTDTKERLLETAIELIWQSSYENTGINEICARAGVTKGCFYHYFESKAELFHEAAEYHWEKMKQEMDRIFSPNQTSLEQLEGLIGFIIEKQGRDQRDDNPVSGCPIFTSGAQCGCEESEVRRTAVEMSDRAVRYATALVKNLMVDGHLASDCDPHQIGRMLHSYIQGLLLYGRIHHDLDVVKIDLREGLYRLIHLKPELRKSKGKGAKHPDKLSAAQIH